MSRFDLWRDAYRKAVRRGFRAKSARRYARHIVAKHLKESA